MATDGPHSKCGKAEWYDLLHPFTKSLVTARTKDIHEARRHLWKQAFTSKALHDGKDQILSLIKQLDHCIQADITAGRASEVSDLVYWLCFDRMADFIQCNLRLALEAGDSAATEAGRNPTIKEIISIDIPYLESTTQEILRFANPATAVDRKALVDTQILGHAVPKVNISNRSPQRTADTRPWDQPDLALFNPEHWILHGQFDLGTAPRVAFGPGPRACPEKRLAYLEISRSGPPWWRCCGTLSFCPVL
ncbi:cytochrome P450 [Aspergillus spectabilis]